MVRYLIYFEDIPEYHAGILELCARYFEGYTLRQGYTGYWKGEPEDSAILEILGEYPDTAKVYRLAEDIRILAHQDTVLVASSPVQVESISAGTSRALIEKYTRGNDYIPQSRLEVA